MQEKKEQGQPKGGTGSNPEVGKQGGEIGKQGGTDWKDKDKSAGTPAPGQGTGQQR